MARRARVAARCSATAAHPQTRARSRSPCATPTAGVRRGVLRPPVVRPDAVCCAFARARSASVRDRAGCAGDPGPVPSVAPGPRPCSARSSGQRARVNDTGRRSATRQADKRRFIVGCPGHIQHGSAQIPQYLRAGIHVAHLLRSREGVLSSLKNSPICNPNGRAMTSALARYGDHKTGRLIERAVHSSNDALPNSTCESFQEKTAMSLDQRMR